MQIAASKLCFLAPTGALMRIDKDDGGRFKLHLLDAAEGHPVQTWEFSDCLRVNIGRSPDNDIVLADNRVSRLHVELSFADDKWVLRSHGRNGTLVEGCDVSEARLRDKAVFQLGLNGPTFQFVTVSSENSSLATIDNIDPSALDFLHIDEQRKVDEVSQITESDTFRQLKEKARQLKGGQDTCIPETEI